MQPRMILSSASQNLEGKNDTPSKAAPRRKGEYSRTRTGVRCRSSSRKSGHLRIECANKRPSRINGEKTSKQCGFGYYN